MSPSQSKKILNKIVAVIKNDDSDLANEIARIINQRIFKFSELSAKAQKVAATDYMNEYNETKSWDSESEENYMTLREAYSCSRDCEDELFYYKDGKCVEQ